METILAISTMLASLLAIAIPVGLAYYYSKKHNLSLNVALLGAAFFLVVQALHVPVTLFTQNAVYSGALASFGDVAAVFIDDRPDRAGYLGRRHGNPLEATMSEPAKRIVGWSGSERLQESAARGRGLGLRRRGNGPGPDCLPDRDHGVDIRGAQGAGHRHPVVPVLHVVVIAHLDELHRGQIMARQHGTGNAHPAVAGVFLERAEGSVIVVRAPNAAADPA